MKNLTRPLLPLCLLAFAVFARPAASSPDWEGAWRSTEGANERLLLVIDGFWTYTVFDPEAPQFHRTLGGLYESQGNRAITTLHFNSERPESVGSTMSLQVELSGDELQLHYEDGAEELWQRIEEEPTPLSGVWRIIGRARDGEMTEMPLRARRTLKVLTGSRFQWIAMNIETGEFSGTGGGRYTFEDGIYVEKIDFFSRDNSRVGAELEFQGEVKDGQWHHQGLSSRGDPIYEIWSRIDLSAER